MDQQMIDDIKHQNEQGVQHLLKAYGGLLKVIITKHLYHLQPHVDECINDTLLAIWNNIDSYDPEKSSFKNWIAVIAKYQAIDCLRKNQHILKQSELDDQYSYTDKHLDLWELEWNELISDLSADDQNLLNMIYPDDRDANQASVSPQSVKLNGHHVMDGSFGSSEIIDEARQIVSNTQTIHLRDALLDGQQELELTFSESNSKEQAVYQINVDSSELTKDTAVYKMNQNHTFDGRSIDIQQLMINPLTSRLTIEYEGDQETYDVVLKDSDGKSYSFDTNTVDEQADGSYKAMLTFNPDFSEGSIESLNEADTLTFYFTGQDSFKNGDVKNNFNTDDNEAFTYHLKR
jgi:RNA polymerase sigma-70 factor (ECF subfamily)